MIGIEHPRERGRHAEQEADRCGDGDAEQEALADPHQAVVREQQNALIRFATLGERLENVELALLPRPRRRGQIRHDSTGDPTTPRGERDAAQRQEQIDKRFSH